MDEVVLRAQLPARTKGIVLAERTHVPARRMGDRRLLESEPLEALDRHLNANLARFTLGVSPLAFTMDFLDWAVHLAASPGKQLQLVHKAYRKGMRFGPACMALPARSEDATLHRAAARRSTLQA